MVAVEAFAPPGEEAGVPIEDPSLFTWFGIGLTLEEPEFEAAIPGATCSDALLTRKLFRLAWRGELALGCRGNKIEDDAIDVRGDWLGVKNRSGFSSSDESNPSKSSESSSSSMLSLRFLVAGDLAPFPEDPDTARCTLVFC